MRRLVVLCGMLAASAASAAPLGPVIRVQYRHPVTLCAGLCGDFDVVVNPDGHGEYRWRPLDAVKWSIVPFEAGPGRYEAFRKALKVVRPSGMVRAENCDKRPHALPGVIPWTIEWNGEGASTMLESCEERVDRIVRGAFHALRFDRVLRRADGSRPATGPTSGSRLRLRTLAPRSMS